MLFVEALETAKCFEEGVLTSAAAANIGSIMGIGFPANTGGAAQFMTGYQAPGRRRRPGRRDRAGRVRGPRRRAGREVRRPVPAHGVPAGPRRPRRVLPRLSRTPRAGCCRAWLPARPASACGGSPRTAFIRMSGSPYFLRRNHTSTVAAGAEGPENIAKSGGVPNSRGRRATSACPVGQVPAGILSRRWVPRMPSFVAGRGALTTWAPGIAVSWSTASSSVTGTGTSPGGQLLIGSS